MDLTTRKRLRNFAIGMLFFLSGVEYAVILPSLWLYLEGFGAELYYFGLVFSAFSISSFFAGPLFGFWVDHRRKTKLVIFFANMFEVVGNFLYFVSWNKYWVLGSRFFCGVGSGTGAAIFAQLTWTTTVQERTAVFSLTMATRNIGLLVGPGLNILFKDWDFKIGPFHVTAYRAPGLFMAILWVVAQILVLFLYYDLPSIEESSPIITQETERLVQDAVQDGYSYGAHDAVRIDRGEGEKEESLKQLAASLRGVRRERSLSMSQRWSIMKEYLKEEAIVILASQFVMFFNETAFEALTTPLLEKLLGWTAVTNSIFFCLVAVESIFVFILVSILSKKFTDRWLLLFGITVEGMALVLYTVMLGSVEPYSPVILPTITVGTILIVLGIPFFAVSGTSLFSKLTDARTQGVGHGIRRSSIGLAMIMGPLWSGALVNRLYICLGVMISLLVILTIMMCLSFSKLKEQEYPHLEPTYDGRNGSNSRSVNT